MQLNWLVVFLREKYVSEINKKERNQSKVKLKLLKTLNMNESSSTRAKSERLTTNIFCFWLYNLAAWKQYLLFFLDLLNTNMLVTPRSKMWLDFLSNFNLRLGIYHLSNCFLFCLDDLNIRKRFLFFLVNLLAV